MLEKIYTPIPSTFVWKWMWLHKLFSGKEIQIISLSCLVCQCQSDLCKEMPKELNNRVFYILVFVQIMSISDESTGHKSKLKCGNTGRKIRWLEHFRRIFCVVFCLLEELKGNYKKSLCILERKIFTASEQKTTERNNSSFKTFKSPASLWKISPKTSLLINDFSTLLEVTF